MKRILVIDDEPAVAHMISASLRAAGVQHTIDYCSDGAEGRKKATQDQYDLITLDRSMPFMGGAEALKEIKRNAKSASIPVVMITAQNDPEFHKQAMELGAAALVTKPFRPQELADILRQVLAGGNIEPPDSKN